MFANQEFVHIAFACHERVNCGDEIRSNIYGECPVVRSILRGWSLGTTLEHYTENFIGIITSDLLPAI